MLWLSVLIFLLSLALHAFAVKIFPRVGLLDFPERYGLRRPRLPYPAGIVAVVLFLVMFILLAPRTMQNAGLIASIVILGIASFLDDRRSLSPLLRLGLQLVVVFLLFLTGSCVGGRICSVTNPLEGILGGLIVELNGALPILSAIITMGWLVLTINAMNWSDGIPGQAAVLSFLGFLTIGFLALSDRVGQPGLATLAFVLATIAGGGIFFEFPVPRMLLGDTGAMFYGLMLGVLSVYAGGKVATAFLVLGVPLIDGIIVGARRILRGRSPLRSGPTQNEHLHHRLLAAGWPPQMIVMLNTVLGIAFGATALFLDTREKFIAAGLLFAIIVGISMLAGTKKFAR